jgi:hypothetical protein
MNTKIGRNFEFFTPCDFIAAIIQHVPDDDFQLVGYYGRARKQSGPGGARSGAAIRGGGQSSHLALPRSRALSSVRWLKWHRPRSRGMFAVPFLEFCAFPTHQIGEF